MIAMIDRALLYKEKYNEHKKSFPMLMNPYEKFKNAEQYLGWREVSMWFTGLFQILNSTQNRLGSNEYSHNLKYLKDFSDWFELWKCECIDRQEKSLPENHSSYLKMTGFFTKEASDDCITMVKSIIQMTEYYCCRKNHDSSLFFHQEELARIWLKTDSLK